MVYATGMKKIDYGVFLAIRSDEFQVIGISNLTFLSGMSFLFPGFWHTEKFNILVTAVYFVKKFWVCALKHICHVLAIFNIYFGCMTRRGNYILVLILYYTFN